MFPYSEYLHSNIKDAPQCITIIPIKLKNIIHIKCHLFFNECTEYIITDEELDYRLNASIINFSVYNYQRRCATYGIFPNESIVCISREENKYTKNDIRKRPINGKKKRLTKI